MASQGKLARSVAIVGAGMSKFGAFKDKTSRDLFVEAFKDMEASVDKGFDPKDIQSIYVSTFAPELFEDQCHMGPIVTDAVGLIPRPATRIEGACAAGGIALRQGVLAIASGICDMVLIGGVEKMSNLATEQVQDTLAAASDIVYEAAAAFTFPGLYAAIGTAHMAKYGTTVEDFMRVGIKNHNHGQYNPKGQFNQSIRQLMENRKKKCEAKGQYCIDYQTEMDFMQDPAANPTVAWPMRLFDCSPISDGAACLLLVSEEIAKNFTDKPIHIIGSGQASDYSQQSRPDMTTIGAAKEASKQAYEMAGVKAEDIQVTEVHDCFTIAELVALEDLGYFKPGQAAAATANGTTTKEGPKPVNCSGGLKSKGHPIGASGLGQALEIFKQLRGEAGDRQVPNKNLRLGLTHNVGATGASCAVHIYERRS